MRGDSVSQTIWMRSKKRLDYFLLRGDPAEQCDIAKYDRLSQKNGAHFCRHLDAYQWVFTRKRLAAGMMRYFPASMDSLAASSWIKSFTALSACAGDSVSDPTLPMFILVQAHKSPNPGRPRAVQFLGTDSWDGT